MVVSWEYVKGLSREELASCNDLVLALPERIKSIPDGTTYMVKQTGGRTASASLKNIKFDWDGTLVLNFFQQIEESNLFREEYEMRKMLRYYIRDTLKNSAHDMEELDRQVPLIDEMDTKVGNLTSNCLPIRSVSNYVGGSFII
ncbi:Syntaxin-71 [Camellia lanceoleosa]|uniref:Syntaxin-71 n=1 Tax=Camellia lanceoleosa TaxID=1840588 RepID=A0ACC0FSD5_9ERIC|nr:Syntaxin-71 [Camellia lanceoleosa]